MNTVFQVPDTFAYPSSTDFQVPATFPEISVTVLNVPETFAEVTAMINYAVYLNQRSPSDPPAGLDVLIVNFLESLAAVTASSANEDVVT